MRRLTDLAFLSRAGLAAAAFVLLAPAGAGAQEPASERLDPDPPAARPDAPVERDDARPEDPAAFTEAPEAVREGDRSRAQEPFSRAPEGDAGESAWYERVELGVTLDLLTELTEAEGSHERFNTLRARSVQLNVDSELEDFGRAYATVDFADGGDGSDLVLREAAVWIDHLPGDLRFRAGKFFADLGAWNGVLPNEFPSPNLDGTRRDYLGGNLSVAGCELHHHFDLGEHELRWSAGVGMELEEQDVDAPENGLGQPEFGTNTFGRRGIANFSGQARIAYDYRLAETSSLVLGVSGLYTPERTVFTLSNPDGVVGTADDQTVRDDLRQSLVGADLTLRSEDPDGPAYELFTVEAWYDNSEFRSPTLAGTTTDGSFGFWGMFELGFDDYWSFGGLGSWHERRDLAVQDESSYHSAFLTYRFTEWNRVNLFLTHTNPGFGIEKFFTAGVQWVVTLGAPRRGGSLSWGTPEPPESALN